MKDSDWRTSWMDWSEWWELAFIVIALVLVALAWAMALTGCAQAVIPVPVQVKPNSYVVYYVVDLNAAACWVDHYDEHGTLVGHDICPATPVLGGFGPTMTGTVAVGTAVGAIAK